MAGTSKTGFSALGGGGRGYINIGGWNTTLTDRATSPKEVVGAWRREGANLYVYGPIGTGSAQPEVFLVNIGAAVFTVGTENVIPWFILTSEIAGGTANYNLIKGRTICTCDTGTYGWYFVQGVCTVQLQTNTTTLAVSNGIQASTSSANKVQIATTTAQGFILTAIACDVSGPAYISFLPGWQGPGNT